MKFFLLLSLLLAPSLAFAHTNDQQPLLRINGDFCPPYNVGGTSLQDFSLPQDMAAKNYLVNQTLHIEFLKENLPFLPDELSKVVLDWDFGDSSKATGFVNDHSYTTMGSKQLTVYSKLPTDTAPVLLNTIRITILPKADYQLPTASFTLNGEKSDNPYTTILSASFKQVVRFDASQSSGGSSPITSYLWDYGDGQAGRGKQSSHSYAAKYSAVAPLVRVTNKDGFIADGFVQVENKTLDTSTKTPTTLTPLKNKILFITLGILGLFIIALGARYRLRK